MAALTGSVSSSLRPIVAPFGSHQNQHRHVTPTEVGSQINLPLLHLEISSTRSSNITESGALLTERVANIGPSYLQNYIKSSTPPTVAKYSKEELGNYFKISPAQTIRPLIDPLALFSGYRREFSDQSSKYLKTMAAPHIVTYFSVFEKNEGIETEHLWFSAWDKMSITDIIPGIPAPYAKEVAEGRALYVIGMPPGFSTQAVINVFEQVGKVDKSPLIIDLNTHCVFRWVIMETAEQASIAMETRSGHNLAYKGKDHTMYICKALPPGNSVVLSGYWNLARYFLGNHEVDQEKTHGHPEVSDKSTTPDGAPRKQVPLAPIPKSPLQFVASSSRDKVQIKPGTTTATTTEQTKAAVKTSSWANIAGTVDAASKTIDLRTGNKSSAVVTRTKPTIRIPSDTRSSLADPLAEQARVIFLLELPQNITLTDISSAIKEGPLHTIQFGTNEDTRELYAGIIFQHARDAESFFQVLCKERADKSPGRFRFIVEARRGEEPFPADDTIKLMGYPTYATRRLTIVKSQFFFVFKEAQLRALFQQEIGTGPIELIWIYNGGNATVVFAKVEDAVAVKKRLDLLSDEADKSSHFYGLHTTFSKDPCIQPVHCI